MVTCSYSWESITAGWIAFCAMVALIAWAKYKNKGS